MDKREETFYRENLRTLLHYKESGWPEIKSYFGKLEGTDSWRQLTGWWGGGASLQDTVIVISHVVERFLKEITPADVTTLVSLEESVALIFTQSLEKYQNDLGTPGLEELKELSALLKIRREVEEKKLLPPHTQSPEKGVYEQNPFSFQAYVETYCRPLSYFAAKEYAKEGNELLTDLYNGKKIVLDSDHLVSEKQLASFIWALMEKAVTLFGAGMEGGEFFLLDPERALYYFLIDYAKEKARESLVTIPFSFSTLPVHHNSFSVELVDVETQYQSVRILLHEKDSLYKRSCYASPKEEMKILFSKLFPTLQVNTYREMVKTLSSLSLVEYRKIYGDPVLFNSYCQLTKYLYQKDHLFFRRGEEIIFGPEVWRTHSS